MLRCGHDFCEDCLDKMLEPVPPALKRRERFECPSCWQECATVYGLQGA
jgi:hypothetical protein